MSDAQTLFLDFDHRRDEVSFRRLYRYHTPTLFALAVRLSGSRGDAEELTQEAWVRAVERHDSFMRESQYGTWLTGILINCCREAARRIQRAPRQLEEDRYPADSATVTALPSRSPAPADVADVERALLQLPVGFREVVILHDLHGYTHREIAELLDIQTGTSKSQLHRGRGRLREILTNTSALGSPRDHRGKS